MLNRVQLINELENILTSNPAGNAINLYEPSVKDKANYNNALKNALNSKTSNRLIARFVDFINLINDPNSGFDAIKNDLDLYVATFGSSNVSILDYFVNNGIENIGLYILGKVVSGKVDNPNIVIETLDELQNYNQDILNGVAGYSNQTTTTQPTQPTQQPTQSTSSQPPVSTAVSNVYTPAIVANPQQLISPNNTITDNIGYFNQYIINQWQALDVISNDVIQDLLNIYPNLMSDNYKTKLLQYNNIVSNQMIASQIRININDLLLPIPVATSSNQAGQISTATTNAVNQLQQQGFNITSQNLQNQFVMFKQDQRSSIKGVGTYVIPEKPRDPWIAKFSYKHSKFILKHDDKKYLVDDTFEILRIINNFRKQFKVYKLDKPLFTKITLLV